MQMLSNKYADFGRAIIEKHSGFGYYYDPISLLFLEGGEEASQPSQENYSYETNLYHMHYLTEENYLIKKNITFLTNLFQKNITQNFYAQLEKHVEKIVKEELPNVEKEVTTRAVQYLIQSLNQTQVNGTANISNIEEKKDFYIEQISPKQNVRVLRNFQNIMNTIVDNRKYLSQKNLKEDYYRIQTKKNHVHNEHIINREQELIVPNLKTVIEQVQLLKGTELATKEVETQLEKLITKTRFEFEKDFQMGVVSNFKQEYFEKQLKQSLLFYVNNTLNEGDVQVELNKIFNHYYNEKVNQIQPQSSEQSAIFSAAKNRVQQEKEVVVENINLAQEIYQQHTKQSFIQSNSSFVHPTDAQSIDAEDMEYLKNEIVKEVTSFETIPTEKEDIKKVEDLKGKKDLQDVVKEKKLLENNNEVEKPKAITTNVNLSEEIHHQHSKQSYIETNNTFVFPKDIQKLDTEAIRPNLVFDSKESEKRNANGNANGNANENANENIKEIVKENTNGNLNGKNIPKEKETAASQLEEKSFVSKDEEKPAVTHVNLAEEIHQQYTKQSYLQTNNTFIFPKDGQETDAEAINSKLEFEFKENAKRNAKENATENTNTNGNVNGEISPEKKEMVTPQLGEKSFVSKDEEKPTVTHVNLAEEIHQQHMKQSYIETNNTFVYPKNSNDFDILEKIQISKEVKEKDTEKSFLSKEAEKPTAANVNLANEIHEQYMKQSYIETNNTFIFPKDAQEIDTEAINSKLEFEFKENAKRNAKENVNGEISPKKKEMETPQLGEKSFLSKDEEKPTVTNVNLANEIHEQYTKQSYLQTNNTLVFPKDVQGADAEAIQSKSAFEFKENRKKNEKENANGNRNGNINENLNGEMVPKRKETVFSQPREKSFLSKDEEKPTVTNVNLANEIHEQYTKQSYLQTNNTFVFPKDVQGADAEVIQSNSAFDFKENRKKNEKENASGNKNVNENVNGEIVPKRKETVDSQLGEKSFLSKEEEKPTVTNVNLANEIHQQYAKQSYVQTNNTFVYPTNLQSPEVERAKNNLQASLRDNTPPLSEMEQSTYSQEDNGIKKDFVDSQETQQSISNNINLATQIHNQYMQKSQSDIRNAFVYNVENLKNEPHVPVESLKDEATELLKTTKQIAKKVDLATEIQQNHTNQFVFNKQNKNIQNQNQNQNRNYHEQHIQQYNQRWNTNFTNTIIYPIAAEEFQQLKNKKNATGTTPIKFIEGVELEKYYRMYPEAFQSDKKTLDAIPEKKIYSPATISLIYNEDNGSLNQEQVRTIQKFMNSHKEIQSEIQTIKTTSEEIKRIQESQEVFVDVETENNRLDTEISNGEKVLIQSEVKNSVERQLTESMNTITDRVYQKLESRLKSERSRRGLI